METNWAPLIDASDMELRALMEAQDQPNVKAVLERLLTSLDDPNGVISAFQSFAGAGS